MSISVAIYVRLSDEDRNKKYKGDESESIQNQKSMLTDFCRERNWEIYDIYNDEDYSGTDSSVELPQAGVYVVRTGAVVKKIAVR